MKVSDRRARPRSADRDIGDDTPIIPEIIAENVVREVWAFFEQSKFKMEADFIGARGPSFEGYLVDRAERLYRAHKSFGQMIRSEGNAGRDWLYMFMRHWLASKLKRENAKICQKLPDSFANGEKLVY